MSEIYLPDELINSFPRGELSSVLDKQPDLTLTSSSVYDGGKSESVFKTFCDNIPENDTTFKPFCDLNKKLIFKHLDYTRALGAQGGIDIKFYTLPPKNRHQFLMPIVTPVTVGSDKADKSFPLEFVRTDEPSGIDIIAYGKKIHMVTGLYLFYNGGKNIKMIDDYAMWPTTGTTPLDYSPPLNFIKRYDSDFEEAAKILNAAHPDIHINNARLWIKSHFIHELHNLDAIDFWQDISACREVNCEVGPALEAAFPEISQNSNVPMMWKTITTIRHNKLKQGFGPGQIILGQAMEAASESAIFARYAHVLPADCATDPNAILSAILDPKKAIYIKTIIYDHLLTKLKETVFKSSEVRFPSDVYPYISNPATARETALINIAQILAIYPEEFANVKNWLKQGMGLQHFNDLCGYADMLKIEPHFPGLTCQKRLFDRLTYATKGEFGPQLTGDLKSEEASWYVYFIGPGWTLNDLVDTLLEPFKRFLSLGN